MINKNYLNPKPYIYNLSELLTVMLYGKKDEFRQTWYLHNNMKIDSIEELHILSETVPFTMLEIQILQAILIKFNILNKTEFKANEATKKLEAEKVKLTAYNKTLDYTFDYDEKKTIQDKIDKITTKLSKHTTQDFNTKFSITTREICDYMNVAVTRDNRFDAVVKRNLITMKTKVFWLKNQGLYINFNDVFEINNSEISITINRSLNLIATYRDANYRSNPIMLMHFKSKYSNLLAEYLQRKVQQTTQRSDTFHIWNWHYRGIRLNDILELFSLDDTPKNRQIIKKSFSDIKAYCDEEKLCFPLYKLNAKTKMYEIKDFCYPSAEVLNNLSETERKVMGIREEVLCTTTIHLWSA